MARRDSSGMILGVREIEEGQEFREIGLQTSRGETLCRHYKASGATVAVIMVGGAGGGWDSPSKNLYPRLAADLLGSRISSLRVRFRNAHSLPEALHDVRAGVAFLQNEGCAHVALVGHSFGGAVVIQAAYYERAVKSVIALATQSYGAGVASDLGPRCSILLIHGSEDPVLPAESSEHVYSLAQEPKQLIIFPGATHNLDEESEAVFTNVKTYLLEYLD
ncbi:MAG: alpha/beta hydrolase [Chitinispirillaceae bacterium]